MRTTNNTKWMLTTRILGLFLTAALPLTVTINYSSTVFAADIEKEQKPLTDIIADIAKKGTFKPIDLSVPALTEEAKPDLTSSSAITAQTSQEVQYNLGMQLHHLQKLMGRNDKLNELLAELNKVLDSTGALNTSNFTAACVEMTITWFTEVLETIHRGTHESVPSVIEHNPIDLTIVRGLYDLGVTSLTYINELDILRAENLKNYESKSSELADAFKIKKDETETTKNVKKSKYEEEKSGLDKQASSVTNLGSSIFGPIRKEEVKDIQTKLETIKREYEEEIEALDKKLSDQDATDKQTLVDLTAAHKKEEGILADRLRVIFKPLGKTDVIGYLWNGKFNREDSKHYLDLNKILSEQPSALEIARKTMVEAFQTAKIKSEHYTSEVIKETLFHYLGITVTAPTPEVISVNTQAGAAAHLMPEVTPVASVQGVMDQGVAAQVVAENTIETTMPTASVETTVEKGAIAEAVVEKKHLKS